VTLGLHGMAIGLVLGMLTGAQALGFFGMALIRRWQYAFNALLLSLLLPLAGLALAWWASTPFGFGVAFFAVGLGGGMTFNLCLFYSVQGARARGSNAGLHEAIGGLGWMLGPFLGGVVARQVSLPATSLLNLALVALLLAGISLYWVRLKAGQRDKVGHIAA